MDKNKIETIKDAINEIIKRKIFNESQRDWLVNYFETEDSVPIPFTTSDFGMTDQQADILNAVCQHFQLRFWKTVPMKEWVPQEKNEGDHLERFLF
jgi:hypothetical protein